MTSYEQPRKASDSSVHEMLFLPSAAERLMCAKPHEGLATHLLSQLLLDEEASGEDPRTPVTKTRRQQFLHRACATLELGRTRS